MGLLSRTGGRAGGLLERAPRWLSIAVGVGCVGLGLVLVVRPFLSLGALVVLLAIALVVAGAAELVRGSRSWSALLALAWIGAGAAVLALPSLTIAALVLVVGAALVVGGAVDGVRALRGPEGDRGVALALAIVTMLLGLLALAWPDVSVLAIAALFGARLALLGVALLRRRPARAGGAPRERRRRAVAALALVATVGATLLSAHLSASPRPDASYDPPADVPSTPGALLRSEPFDRAMPDSSTAWRILYTTTDADGRPAVASGLVIVPERGAQHPVIAWAHGTTGFATGCAPTLLDEPLAAGAMPDPQTAIDAGWAVVATDYAGLGTAGSQPYLIGEGEGRSVLDAVRAAQRLGEAAIAPETVLWGHSQGGHAALWAGGMAADYAPELEIVGVAAMAPATDLPALLDGVAGSVVGPVFASFALAAYDAAYPDVAPRDSVRPGARIMVQSMQQRCLTDPATLVSLATSVFSGAPVFSRSPGDGALGARAAENVPTLPIDAPVLVAQGGADSLITPDAQAGWVAARCAEGWSIDHRTYDGLDHMGLVTGESALLPELAAWTAARFAGEPAPVGCR
ncbi:lipase family protein [Agrococcus lahaulensis]|uniref:lipase family protein n=1 Tax=Agrococcus lahaulensis TaxID=341722 RepID=UPI000400D7CA|nr:lipase family protein [Agrococcus lahaulensis]